VKVDPKRFFSLVTAIAGVTACAKDPAPDTPPLPPLEVRVPPQPEAPSATVAITQPPPSTTREAPAEPPSAPVAEVASSSPIDTFDPNAKHTCSELRCPGGPSAEGMRVLMHDCRKLEKGLRPEHFQRFVQCMLRQNNSRSTCDLRLVGTDPGECLERWSDPKVLDSKAAAACAPVVQKCGAKPSPGVGRKPMGGPVPPPKALTTAECTGILSVTKDAERPRMVACMTEYCEEAPRLCYMDVGGRL
jgi:hypothetical protein